MALLTHPWVMCGREGRVEGFAGLVLDRRRRKTDSAPAGRWARARQRVPGWVGEPTSPTSRRPDDDIPCPATARGTLSTTEPGQRVPNVPRGRATPRRPPSHTPLAKTWAETNHTSSTRAESARPHADRAVEPSSTALHSQQSEREPVIAKHPAPSSRRGVAWPRGTFGTLWPGSVVLSVPRAVAGPGCRGQGVDVGDVGPPDTLLGALDDEPCHIRLRRSGPSTRRTRDSEASRTR